MYRRTGPKYCLTYNVTPTPQALLSSANKPKVHLLVPRKRKQLNVAFSLRFAYSVKRALMVTER
jgi:hypothetical protein